MQYALNERFGMKRIVATDASVAIGPYLHAMQSDRFDSPAFAEVFGKHLIVHLAHSRFMRVLPKGAPCEVEAIAIAKERLS